MRLFIALVFVLAFAITFAGCSGSGPRTGTSSKSFRTSGHSVFIEGGDVPNKPGAVLFHIIGQSVGGKPARNFWVYAFSAKGQRKDWRIHCSEPEFELVSGWGYFFGQTPVAITKRVRAIGTGTRMVVEIDETANVHRVYLLYDLKAPDATVEITSSSGATETIRTPRWFCEINSSGEITKPLNLDLKDDAGALVYPIQHAFIREVEATTGDVG